MASGNWYKTINPGDKVVVIIGAGVFGLSTAYQLLTRGYKDVTVLDRAQELPARDGAGYDLNKGVYSDVSGSPSLRESPT